MAARRGDLQRPLGLGLSAHVGEILGIGRSGRFVGDRLPGCERSQRFSAVKQVAHLREACGPVDLNPLDHGPLGGILHRDDQPPEARPAGLHGQRQHAPHGFERTVERQLPGEHRPLERPGVDALHRGENPHGDGQVEARALLAQVGGGKAHDHLAARHPLARVLEGGADALLALLDGVVGQADQVETQPAARNVDLDGHRHGVDSDHRTRISPDEHRCKDQKGGSSSSEAELRISNSPPMAEPSPPPCGAGAAFEPLA